MSEEKQTPLMPEGQQPMSEQPAAPQPATEATPAMEAPTAATPMPEQPAMETAAPAAPAPKQPVPAAKAPMPEAPAMEAAAPSGEVRYAGFWIRFVAFMMDCLIIFMICYALEMVSGIQFMIRVIEGGQANFHLTGPGMLVVFLYFVILTGSKMQATIGKRMLGMYVRRQDGSRITYMRSFGRLMATILSNLTIMIGYIMAGMMKEKTALHDLVADTRVVKGKPA